MSKQAFNVLDKSAGVANKVVKMIVDETKGNGALVTITLAIVLSSLEAQHEGTISDILEGVEKMLAIINEGPINAENVGEAMDEATNMLNEIVKAQKPSSKLN